MLIRKNLPSSMTSLIEEQGFSTSDIGMISSSFALSYGISKFLGSIISDNASPRKVFSFGLIMASVCSLVFPLARTVSLACVLWFIEGIMQGFGWPPCVILLNAWYPPSQIGRWWSILASAGNITSAIIPLLVVYLTSVSHWSTSYYVFGLCALFMGILVMFSIKDSPRDIGYTAFNGHTKKEDEANVSSDGSWYKVFFIPNLWAVSIVYSILYLTNGCSLNWCQLFFVQEVGMSETRAAASFTIFQVGSVFGNLTAGWLSDLFVTPVSWVHHHTVTMPKGLQLLP